jgi:hypothetical protein
LIANPAIREAAGRTARKRIEDHYQWQQIAEDIEKAYFNILGWKAEDLPSRKATVREGVSEDSLRERQAV